jgi:hypothetical protein
MGNPHRQFQLHPEKAQHLTAGLLPEYEEYKLFSADFSALAQ